MPLPEMPWTQPLVNAVQPLNPFMQLFLFIIAGACIYVAIRGDAVTRTAFFIYLVAP